MTSPQNPWQQGQNPQFAPQAGQPQAPVPPQQPVQAPVNTQAPGYPQVPAGYPQQVPGGKPPRPGTVNFATLLGLLVPPFSAFVSVVTLVMVLIDVGADFGDGAFWEAMGLSFLLTFGAVVCAVLWIVFSLLMRGGRGWARIVLVVLAGLWLAYDLYSIVMTVINPYLPDADLTDMYTWYFLIDCLQMFFAFVMPVLFMILVFVKPSNDYFKAVRAR